LAFFGFTKLSELAPGVLLVGSVPLANATEVFRGASEHLGQQVCRIPDGETGERSNWIGWQMPKLSSSKGLAPVEEEDGNYGTTGQIGLAGPLEDVEIENIGYRDEDLASYAEFAALKSIGIIAADCRFQVCLPTPLAPIHLYVRAVDRVELEKVYEAALLRELQDIVAAIPAAELAIQWDTAIEFGVLEGVFPTYLDDPPRQIVERLVRLGGTVPDEIELGYHLCYGDAGHKHFVEPADMSKLVLIANEVSVGLERVIHWIHMPVPRDRSDDEYFQPLENLSLKTETELFLGLVHSSDGVAGALARVATARKFFASFGVATECGLGRRLPESIPALLDLHKTIADTL
jgi:hypothetical protein